MSFAQFVERQHFLPAEQFTERAAAPSLNLADVIFKIYPQDHPGITGGFDVKIPLYHYNNFLYFKSIYVVPPSNYDLIVKGQFNQIYLKPPQGKPKKPDKPNCINPTSSCRGKWRTWRRTWKKWLKEKAVWEKKPEVEAWNTRKGKTTPIEDFKQRIFNIWTKSSYYKRPDIYTSTRDPSTGQWKDPSTGQWNGTGDLGRIYSLVGWKDVTKANGTIEDELVSWFKEI